MDENTAEYTETEKLIRVIVEASTTAATKAAILALRHQGIEPTEEEKDDFFDTIYKAAAKALTDPDPRRGLYQPAPADDEPHG